MRKYKLIIALLLSVGFWACESKILDLDSLTEPIDATFFSNEAELELALAGVYNSIILRDEYRLPVQVSMDNAATDIGVVRMGAVGYAELGSGSHSAATGGFQQTYSNHYKGIARANALLQNMERAKNVVPEAKFNDIKSQALVLRAYHYMYLTELFGAVPYVDKIVGDPADGLQPRTEKASIVEKLLAELQQAASVLPLTRPQADKGKITRAVALTLRARIALYNKNYTEAAASAKAVMEMEAASGLGLHPKYEDLFNEKGQDSKEIMFVMPYKDGFIPSPGVDAFSLFPQAHGSRNLGGFSIAVPTQSLIDSYEAIDGLPIDESPLYLPSNPFAKRDPRMAASIILPQSKWAGIIFESHKDSTKYRNAAGQIVGNNSDCRTISWPAAFCGYLWKKYTHEANQQIREVKSYLNFSLMRYAEVLLIYAEAKIELNQIDATVLNSINRIRARAYGADVSATSSYPAITATNQAELRKVIRRERKIELANEGFRLFDIRRWKIAEKVMPVKLYGRILNTKTATKVPQIDDDCFVSYAGIESQYDLNTDSRFTNAIRVFNKNRDYLCPIPQQEIDTYKGAGVTLEQNPGY